MQMRTSGKATPMSEALFKRAIQDAIRVLPSLHEWQYYRRQARFKSSPQAEMTVTYDASGGSVERLLTITSGDTWPQDASYGHIVIGGRTYRIEKRLSDIQATLEADFTPLGDFTSSVLWQRPSYRFSREIAKVHYCHNLTIDRPVQYVPSADHQAGSYDPWLRGGYTEWFTWQNRGNRFGSSEFVLIPPPTTAQEFEVSATVVPHIPTINAVNGSVLEGTTNASQITSESAVFDQRIIGTILRISRDSSPPTEFNSGNWEFQAFVTGVTDTNTLNISEPLPATYAGRGFVLSSPIDVDSAVMLESLEDFAFMQYTKNHKHESYGMASSMHKTALLNAIRRDNKVSLNSRLWNNEWWGFGVLGLGGITEAPTNQEI